MPSLAAHDTAISRLTERPLRGAVCCSARSTLRRKKPSPSCARAANSMRWPASTLRTRRGKVCIFPSCTDAASPGLHMWLRDTIGGSLGWKTRGSLVATFEAVAFELVRAIIIFHVHCREPAQGPVPFDISKSLTRAKDGLHRNRARPPILRLERRKQATDTTSSWLKVASETTIAKPPSNFDRVRLDAE